jgi:predicted transglutaminase-like cysteine proteinase
MYPETGYIGSTFSFLSKRPLTHSSSEDLTRNPDNLAIDSARFGDRIVTNWWGSSMARQLSAISFVSLLAATVLATDASARSRLEQASGAESTIAEGAPTLAPFQHVRFCLRYPAECKSNSTDRARIELTREMTELLKQVNHSVNGTIAPRQKNYGTNLADGWTLAPVEGDCNDYAVTKRHELMQNGLPARALRLSVVKTASGVGHLVLVVSTTNGDLVLDNLTGEIRSWQRTNYTWLKIQSSADARFWSAVKPNGLILSQAEQRFRLANR